MLISMFKSYSNRAVVRIFVLTSLLSAPVCFSSSIEFENQQKNPIELKVGAERIASYLSIIKDKRLGVVVNQTSMVGSQHLVDLLIEKEMRISRVFAPEHGFRGDKGAGEIIDSKVDKTTGLEIVSLYGENKQPQPDQLKDIDLLVFDIQDVGVRYYTYISTMHLLMESCAKENKPLLILDRPNPNGDYIDGPVLESRFRSFVGMHEIPLVHGLTVGELANMINGEGWLKSGKRCDLKIIKVANYDHATQYYLPVKPSPNLPNHQSIRLYPSLGFFEATPVSVGRGTDWPFQVLGYPNSAMGEFEFKTRAITGSWKDLNHTGEKLFGMKLESKNNRGINLDYIVNWKAKFDLLDMEIISRPFFLNKLAGSEQFAQMLQNKESAIDIKRAWADDLVSYQKLRKQYLLYPDHPDILRYVVPR
ncbi:MAG: DUF1343 domain-containing protein [Kangiellaceae bacterium]|nr:DUF1343 domain-containing protein [Kangiellaceae bacterium]